MSDEGADGSVATELNRDIGMVGAISLGVGTMIAAGIFVLSGLAVSNVGAMAIVSFLIAAVVASFTAFAYAEFASIYPESGGGYAYVSNVFDTDLTYIVGWSMILGYPASAAFYLASFSDWFSRFIYPLLGVPEAVPFWVSGLFVLALLLGVNFKGTEESGQFQILVTALKVVLILVFLAGGLQAFRSDVIVESFATNAQGIGDFRDVGLTAALVFITFFGFEAIATNAEEIEKPARNVPRAIFISMALVTVVYTAVVVVVVLAKEDPAFADFLVRVSPDVTTGEQAENFIAENGEIAMGRAAQYYLGDLGFYVIIVGALFSMLSAANATILAGSRVKLAMSRRDHLPARFEDLSDRFNTPYNAVFLTGGLITAFIGFFTVAFGGGPESDASLPLPITLPVIEDSIHLGIEAIAHFADFMLLFGLIVVNLAVIYSRRNDPDIERGFEVPFVPVVPIVAVLANLVLLVNVEPGSFLLGLAAEVVGVAVWFGVVAREPSMEEIEQETPTVLQDHSHIEKDYQVLVPIANPEHAPQLMRTARDLAVDNDGEILVMSVVELPEQTPLSEGRAYVDERREVLERAMEAVEDGDGPDVPVGGTVRIGHHADDAILNTIRQYDSDAVLMGWRGHESYRRDIVLGSVVDEVTREASCDVLVERFGEKRPIETILLPTAGGPHAEMAADVSRAIARANDATVTVANVVPPDADEADREAAREGIQRAVAVVDRSDGDVEVETRIVEGDDVADALVELSDEYDLTIIGATREGLLQQLVFGAIPEEVGRRATSTVIMTKRNLGIRSFLTRLLGSE